MSMLHRCERHIERADNPRAKNVELQRVLLSQVLDFNEWNS